MHKQNSFTVFVVNVNEAPYALTYTASRTVVENFSPLFPTAGSNIGFVTPFDYEGGSYTYVLPANAVSGARVLTKLSVVIK